MTTSNIWWKIKKIRIGSHFSENLNHSTLLRIIFDCITSFWHTWSRVKFFIIFLIQSVNSCIMTGSFFIVKNVQNFIFGVSLIVSRVTMCGLELQSQSSSNMRTVGQVCTIFNFENNLTSFHFEMIVFKWPRDAKRCLPVQNLRYQTWLEFHFLNVSSLENDK